MNDQDHSQSQNLVSLDEEHIAGSGNLPERFENPGLPAHTPRLADLDERAAKRAERQVGVLFTVSIVGTIIFLIAYFVIDIEATVPIPGVGEMNLIHMVLGLSMAASLLGIGLGAIHWAKTLMPDVEVVEDRHPMRSADEDRAEFERIMTEDGGKSQLMRRPFIKYSLGGALGLFALPVIVPVVAGLAPWESPVAELKRTFWDGKGGGAYTPMRLVRDPQNTPIKASDVTLGSVFHVMPEGLLDLQHGLLDEKAKAAVLVMRLPEDKITSQKEKDWGHQGIVAYSKICTHAGCPVGLYEQQTHHLLCPCHQSTFDVTDDCKVIFGPAKRPLPQLKITVDDEGYLVSAQPFAEPVGPSFWERNA